ncbi:hypothetical protein [Parashewanella spongiae]|uniref:hypothetical protein n=1 Tax=Parashewanella spongiae TaxID=342950 RepID=UPI00105A43FD|nr:hypothetical protein [Parashewanella spongiae]
MSQLTQRSPEFLRYQQKTLNRVLASEENPKIVARCGLDKTTMKVVSIKDYDDLKTQLALYNTYKGNLILLLPEANYTIDTMFIKAKDGNIRLCGVSDLLDDVNSDEQSVISGDMNSQKNKYLGLGISATNFVKKDGSVAVFNPVNFDNNSVDDVYDKTQIIVKNDIQLVDNASVSFIGLDIRVQGGDADSNIGSLQAVRSGTIDIIESALSQGERSQSNYTLIFYQNSKLSIYRSVLMSANSYRLIESHTPYSTVIYQSQLIHVWNSDYPKKTFYDPLAFALCSYNTFCIEAVNEPVNIMLYQNVILALGGFPENSYTSAIINNMAGSLILYGNYYGENIWLPLNVGPITEYDRVVDLISLTANLWNKAGLTSKSVPCIVPKNATGEIKFYNRDKSYTGICKAEH